MLSEIEQSRLALSKAADPKKKARLGQFFTPAKIAQFMAGLFEQRTSKNYRLLDAGAGIGSLSAAFLERDGRLAALILTTLQLTPSKSTNGYTPI